MPPEPVPNFISCGNVLASGRGITEVESGREMQHVPKAGIDSVSLRHGCSSHRPLLEMVVGSIFSVIGIWGFYVLIIHPAAIRYDIMFIFLGLLGAAMLFDVMKRRYFLEISSKGKLTRIPFSKTTDPAEIREFCSEMERRWSYIVQVSI